MSTSRGVILKGLSEVVSRLGSLAIFPILALYAGASGYGAYTLVTTIVTFIIPFISLGLSESIMKFYSDKIWSKDLRKQLMYILVIIGLLSILGSLLFFIVSPMLNRQFIKDEYGLKIFQWGSGLIIVSAIELILYNFLRTMQWIKYFSILQIVETILLVGATVLFVPKYGLVGFMKINIISRLIIAIFIFLSLWTFFRPILCTKEISKVPLLRMISFGIPVTISGLGFWMMGLGDRLVIGKFMTTSDLGLYNAICTFAAIIASVNSPLCFPFYPKLMKAANLGLKEDIEKYIKLFHRYTILTVIPSSVFIIIAIRPILLLLGGKEFRTQLSLIVIIMFPLVLTQWNSAAYYILPCFNKVIFAQNIWITVGILNVIGNIILVPFYGLYGAGFATLLTYLALDITVFIKASKSVPLLPLYRFDVTLKAILSSLLAGGVIWKIMSFNQQNKWIVIGSGAMIFSLVYLISMVILKEIKKSDADIIFRALYIKRT